MSGVTPTALSSASLRSGCGELRASSSPEWVLEIVQLLASYLAAVLFGLCGALPSVCRLVFSQSLTETPLQISGKVSLHSSFLPGTLPRKSQLPHLPQMPVFVSLTRCLSRFLSGLLFLCQSPAIASKRRTSLTAGRARLVHVPSLRDCSPALAAARRS